MGPKKVFRRHLNHITILGDGFCLPVISLLPHNKLPPTSNINLMAQAIGSLSASRGSLQGLDRDQTTADDA